MSQTLLAISEDAAALGELIEECPEELTPEVEAALDLWMRDLERAESVKVEAICAIARSFSLQAESRKQEADRLRRLVEIGENKVKRLKDLLLTYFIATGQKRVETPLFSVRLQANGGKVPMLVDRRPEELPLAYQRAEITADAEAIRASLEIGVEIDGCRLLPRGWHIRVS